MSAISLVLEENSNAKAFGGITRLLSPIPKFALHTVSSVQRQRVEQYVFDQFQLNHGASVRDFLPLLLTMSCQGGFTANVGIRPASGQDLYLERYLPDTTEQLLSKLAGQRVERAHCVEIGNLVATQRGSSRLLFLILAAVLQRAGFGWLVFTATPQVQNTIKRLGFKLYGLGDADPSVLDADSLNNWGSYYDSQPQVVAGNLSEAVTILGSRRIQARIISIYQKQIEALAIIVKQNS